MILGFDGLFLFIYKLAMLFPLVQIGLAVYTYTSYTACSTAVATYWTGGTTTQVVSCSTYAVASYIPTTVNDDPYQMVTGATSGGAFLLFIYNMMAKGKFNTAFGGDSLTEDKVNAAPADDSSTAAPAAAAPAPAAAAAPAPAAAASSTAPADDSSSTAASTDDSSSASTTPAWGAPDSSTTVEPDNTGSDDSANAADPWNSGSSGSGQ